MLEERTTINVLLCKAGERAEMVEIKDSLESFQEVVGGMIEEYMPFEDDVALVCNDEGKMLGYEIQETLSSIEYNTLWFNLNNISNINSVKSISNGSVDPHENNHDVYLNGSAKKFTPTKNKVAFVSTSRRYDVEMRKQYFYDSDVTEYETDIPMMFIQDDGTESGETNYSTFEEDILKDNSIAASVTLSNTYLNKIRADYLTLIDIFIAHKDDISSQSIADYIGDPAQL